MTVKITCECPIEDTSASGLSDLLYGIDDGQVDGSVEVVEVVEGPIKEVAPSEVLRKRLLAVLDVRPKTIVPILAEKVVVLSARILLNMSHTQILRVRDACDDCAAIAVQYGRSDISAEINCINRELEKCHAG